MAWIATDRNGDVFVYNQKPKKSNDEWVQSVYDGVEQIDKDICTVLIGRVPTWDDAPVEITERPQEG